MLAENIVSYWKFEPYKNEDGVEIGSKALMLNMFNPMGSIPSWVLGKLSDTFGAAIDKFAVQTRKTDDLYQKYLANGNKLP